MHFYCSGVVREALQVISIHFIFTYQSLLFCFKFNLLFPTLRRVCVLNEDLNLALVNVIVRACDCN